MNQDYILNLTLGVYRLSEAWDDSNFLKFKIKNIASEILKDFLQKTNSNSISQDCQTQLLKKINAFQQIINQARAEKLISRTNFLFFKKEYNNLKQEIKDFIIIETDKKPEKLSPKSVIKPPVKQKKQKKVKIDLENLVENLNQRQKKILEILKEKQRAQVWELKPFFPKVSKRTLRRDLDDLLKKKLVQRRGEWNKIFYQALTDGTSDGTTTVPSAID